MANNWPIRRHLFALVLAIVLPMLGLLAYSLQAEVRGNLREASNATETVAQIAAADAQRFINDARLILDGLARRPKVRALDAGNCDEILGDYKNFLPQFINMAIADAAGSVVCSAVAPPGAARASIAGAAWLEQARRANAFIAGHPHVGPVSGRWVSVLAAPVQDDGGRFKGVIGLSIDLVGHPPVAENVRLPAGMVVQIVERGGTVIASSVAPQDAVGRPFPVKAVLDKVNAEGQGQTWTSGRGAGMVYGYAPVAGSDWFVICSVPATTIYYQAAGRAAGTALALLLLTLGAGLFAYHLGRRMVLPIIDMTETAQAVARGELGRRARAGGPQEIARVAAQFNSMLDVRLAAEAKYRNLLESASDAIVVVNVGRRIILANAKTEAMFGYSHAEMIGQSVEMLLPQRFAADHARQVDAYLDRPEPRQRRSVGGLAMFGRRKNGGEFPVEISLSPLHTDDGLIVSSIIRDISERKDYEARLLYMAQYDEVTGLANRNLLRERLGQALARAADGGRQVGLILLNADRFKEVNDTLGHRVGDLVLRSMAERLSAELLGVASVARPGGDEFAIIVENAGPAAQVQALAERIHEWFRAPLQVDAQEIFLSVSIGITVYPDDGDSVEALLVNADVAMYESKQEGRDTFSFYTPALDARGRRRLQLETHLRRALANGELLLHYQPQVDVRSGQVKGVEALVRWDSPELGCISPLEFIGIAEETGLIDPIGRWILRTACLQAKRWQDAGHAPIAMAVNLSPRQFRQQALAAQVEQALRESGLAPAWLELEITEGMLMRRPEEAEQTLRQITATGVRIALDDFGTGYSSLAYLKRFPVGTLKIDQSFVRDLHRDPDDAAIVTAVISLAKSLNMEIVAEGVELPEQLAFLASLDCDYYQGYLFSKPIAADDLGALLARGRAAGAPPPG
jgi:diguanylate cyclase (GGDEF)-like protein/PAS domain S-box-containing protein